MAQIKQLKDTTGNFYPVTHKDAIVGIEDIISNKVDIADFEEATRVTAKALNLFHSNTLWQAEDTYVRCDKSKTLEEAISGESDILYFTTDSHQIVLNGVVYSLQDISGKMDVTDFEEYELATSATLNQLKSDQESMSQHINDVSFITSKTAVKMRQALGVNEDLQVSFKGTHNLDNCTSLIEAILVLDEKLSNL